MSKQCIYTVFNCIYTFSLHQDGYEGSTLEILERTSPNIRCTSLYLPETVESIESKPAGVEVTAGDYFKPETLPTANVILLEYIAHVYPDESKCVELFENCCEIIPISGKIVLCEKVCVTENRLY